jgi:hypothetical protein
MNPDWILPDWDAPGGVRALATTRAGGVSLAPYAGLNLATHVGDDHTFRISPRQRLPGFLACALRFAGGLARLPGWPPRSAPPHACSRCCAMRP